MLPVLTALPSLAQTVTFHFDNEEELLKAGFFHHSAGGSSVFEGGLMTVRSRSYEEWVHYRPPSGSFWFDHAPTARSWVVQARLRLAEGSPPNNCFDAGAGLWIHDGHRLIKLTLDVGKAGLSYPFGHRVDVDTSQFHTYRIEVQGHAVRLRIDDRLVFERAEDATWTSSGTASLVLGSLGCSLATSYWDELSYTIEPGPLGPEPSDGR